MTDSTPRDKGEIERLIAELRTEPRCQCGTLRDPDQSTVTDDAADNLESLLAQLSEAETALTRITSVDPDVHNSRFRAFAIMTAHAALDKLGPTLPKEGTSHEQ